MAGSCNLVSLIYCALITHGPEYRLRISLGALKVIRGQGMPSYRHHEMGDLYVRVKVAFPKHIPPESIPYLQAALSPRGLIQPTLMADHIEEVELSDPDQQEQATWDMNDGEDNAI